MLGAGIGVDWVVVARGWPNLLQSPQVKRLTSAPGVNVTCAAIFLAAVGDIRRFKGSRQVVAYLGLDPRVYQSGSGPARGGRISKQGSPRARWALVVAARSVAQQPGPSGYRAEAIRETSCRGRLGPLLDPKRPPGSDSERGVPTRRPDCGFGHCAEGASAPGYRVAYVECIGVERLYIASLIPRRISHVDGLGGREFEHNSDLPQEPVGGVVRSPRPSPSIGAIAKY